MSGLSGEVCVRGRNDFTRMLVKASLAGDLSFCGAGHAFRVCLEDVVNAECMTKSDGGSLLKGRLFLEFLFKKLGKNCGTGTHRITNHPAPALILLAGGSAGEPSAAGRLGPAQAARGPSPISILYLLIN